MTEQMDKLYQALEKTLYLEPDDLAANQQGKLSERQQQRIIGQLRSAMLGFGCLNLVSIAPAIVLGAVIDNLVVRAIVVMGIVTWLIFLVRTLRGIRNTQQNIHQDLARGEVSALQGTIVKKSTRKGANLYIGIDKKWFLVPQAIFEAVPEGETLVIYYLPTSQQFLALEPLA